MCITRYILNSFLFGALTFFSSLAHDHDHDHDHNHKEIGEHRGLGGLKTCGAKSLSDKDKAKVEQDLAVYRAKNGEGRFDALSRSQGIVNIDVYVHVVYKSDGTGNISDEQITDQMKILNDSFSGVAPSFPNCVGGLQSGGLSTPFKFNLVQTTRRINDAWFETGDETTIVNMVKGIRVGDCSDLNIFVKSHPNDVLGTGSLPFYCDANDLGNDYVFINYEQFPKRINNNPTVHGDTTVHEAGHWLGLEHTFENGCSSPGDHVDDTPFEASPGYGCIVGRNTCPNHPGDDPINNYMDYSDDCCMNTFTTGQIARMVDQAALYRKLNPSAVGITGTLTTGQSYFSANRKYFLNCQPDGNLVLYGPTGPLWWSGTHGNGNACVMQADGNLVVYNNGSPTWHSQTFGNPGAKLTVTDTGSLVISDQNSNMIKAYGVERINGTLEKGKRYESIKKTHSLVFQQDGNLVLYGPTGPLWWSGTYLNGDTCVVQGDGNLVIYKNGSPTWNSGTHGNPGAYFTVFDTGVFVIYDKNGKVLKAYGREARVSGTLSVDQPYFSPNKENHFIFNSGGSLVAYRSGIEVFTSNTNGNGDSCVMQPDGNFVIYNNGGSPTWNSGTHGNPGAYVTMTDTGILAIYNQSGVMLKSFGSS